MNKNPVNMLILLENIYFQSSQRSIIQFKSAVIDKAILFTIN